MLDGINAAAVAVRKLRIPAGNCASLLAAVRDKEECATRPRTIGMNDAS